jgi:hypothetical protein
MLGTVLAVAIAIYVNDGLITGAAPPDEAERDRFYRDGKQPFAIRIGNKWISYQRLEPFNQTFAQVAAIVQAAKETEKDLAGKATQAVATITQNLVSQSYLSGLSNLIDAIRQPERYGPDVLSRLATALAVPASGLTRTIAQLIDPVVRDPRNLEESLKAGIPGLSKQVPAKVTAFGEDVVRQSPAWSPLNITPVQETALTKELDRLKVNTGFISGTIAGVVLNDREQKAYQVRAGKLTSERLSSLISSSAYNTLTDANKEMAIERTVNEARDQARKLILDSISPTEQAYRKKNGLPSENAAFGGTSSASTKEAEKAIEDWKPDWRLTDQKYWDFTTTNRIYEGVKKEEKPKWLKDNPKFIEDQFMYGDRTNWTDGTYEMALSVAERASKMGVPLADIPSFSLTEKGKERLPSDRNLWKPYFDYYDLPGSGGYLSYSKEQVEAGKLPDKYLKDWQTYQKLTTDLARTIFRNSHKEASTDWRTDFRKKNKEFDAWLVSQERNEPLKTASVTRSRPRSSRMTISSPTSAGTASVSSRGRGSKKTLPKFKKISVKMGTSIKAPRAPRV